MKSTLVLVALILVVSTGGVSAGTLPDRTQLADRANSFCQAVLSGDTKRSFELTIHSAKHLIPYERWAKAYGTDPGPGSCRARGPQQITGDQFEQLASSLKARGILIDNAVVQRWRLKGTADDNGGDMEGLWIHADGAWYFVDTSLCDPLE